ncbi:MAG: TonB-dependent receptor plug domain-containing protein [Gemmatimonadaceae bacterium]
MIRYVGILFMAVWLGGCSRRAEPGTVRSSSDVLTREEMETVPVDNVYDAVRRLRPTYLRARTTASSRMAYATVYVDGVRRGSPEVLRSMSPRSVAEVRYLTPAVATTRFGGNVPGGVIEVKSGRP